MRRIWTRSALSPVALTFLLTLPVPALAQPAAEPAPAGEPAPEGLPPEPPAAPEGSLPEPPPEGEAVAAEEPPAAEEGEAPPPARLSLPTFHGPVGLFRVSAAETGGVGQLRLGIHGEYASKDNFLVNGDRDRRFGGSLALGVTPVRQLEIFAALMASANRNDRVCTVSASGEKCVSERGRVDPPIIRSFGDLVLGAKLASKLSGPMHAGLEAGVRLFASNDGLLIASDATSFWFNGLATVDFRESARAPLRLHANVGYYLDNSEKVQDFSGFGAGMIGSKAVSIFAYGINRDRFRMALGLDAPLDKLGSSGFAILPFLEYHAEVITADPDKAFADFMPPKCGSPETPCSDNRDQHWITAGLRAQAPGGFTLDLGFDVALKSPGFPYGPALLPFNFIFGASFPFDFGASAQPKIVTKTVTVEKPVAAAPQEGFVGGKVVGAKGEPIGGAIVGVAGQAKSRVATDADGSFTTKGLQAGTVDLEIVAPNFESQVVKANVVIGQTAEVAATLHPRENKNRVHGRIIDPAGKPLAGATLKIAGPTNATLTSDADGLFTAELTPGDYVARAESGKLPPREQRFEIQVGVDRTLEISFGKAGAAGAVAAAAPTGPAPVAVVNNRLVVRRPVGFKAPGGKPSADLLPSSQQTLDALAGVLATHPEIKKVRVEAHWDNGLPKPEVDELTQQQADSIASYLGRKGVDGSRVQAVGMGASRPRVPNFGPASRAKNRRVEIQGVN